MQRPRLEHLTDIFDKFSPDELLYETSSGLFIVNGSPLAPDKILPIVGNDENKSAEELIRDVPLVLDGWGHPIIMPTLYRWLQDGATAQDLESTIQVMAGVYASLEDESVEESIVANRLWGFSAILNRKRHPVLNTQGDCACLAADIHGSLAGPSYWKEEVVLMGFHNTDSRSQKVSLYAGIGHLAALSIEN